MKTVAAILAGGRGTRFGGEIPKQFAPVAGKTVIEHTIEAFEINPQIDEICVVVNGEYMDIMEEIARKRAFAKLSALICGGKERYDSSIAAIDHYKNEQIYLLIHDAARPKVSQRIITEAAQGLLRYRAVCTACPATDTIAVAAKDELLIEDIPPRAGMFQVQTPQGFHIDVIKKAYDLALSDPDFFATDDCGVVKKYLPDVKIHIIKGSPDNIKITRKEDLKFF